MKNWKIERNIKNYHFFFAYRWACLIILLNNKVQGKLSILENELRVLINSINQPEIVEKRLGKMDSEHFGEKMLNFSHLTKKIMTQLRILMVEFTMEMFRTRIFIVTFYLAVSLSSILLQASSKSPRTACKGHDDNFACSHR